MTHFRQLRTVHRCCALSAKPQKRPRQRLSLPDRSPSESRRERLNHRGEDERLHAFPCEVAGRNQVGACEGLEEACHTQSRAADAGGRRKEWGRRATSSADGEGGHCACTCTWVASGACKGDGGHGSDAWAHRGGAYVGACTCCGPWSHLHTEEMTWADSKGRVPCWPWLETP